MGCEPLPGRVTNGEHCINQLARKKDSFVEISKVGNFSLNSINSDRIHCIHNS